MKLRASFELSLGLTAYLAQTPFAADTNCPTLKSSYPAPVVGDGWSYQLVANNLSAPRGILFDDQGGLLVVQQGAGVVHLEFTDGGSTCLSLSKKTHLINSTELNHGIALSNDGNTLYASSSESVFAWSYNAKDVSVSAENQTIITGMSNDDHTTRTLLMSDKEPGILLVSRGSNSNIDMEAAVLSSGHSQIKAFNVSNVTSTSSPYTFSSEGRLLGWGLRNSVGVAEEPLTGGLYSVENSADEIDRSGRDIHEDNPGEEMNYHGFLNSSTENQGGNYGYPFCYAVWDPNDFTGLPVGSQFVPQPNSTLNDTTCADKYVPPRLTFQAHMAPLDIVFLPNGTEAYISFHGSWDRDEPVGYKVSTVAFGGGAPVDQPNSTTSLTDIFTNANNSVCPSQCFRPVGLALDQQGRLFVSSDATGELYVLVHTGNSSTSNSSGNSTGNQKSTGSHSTSMNGAVVWSVAALLLTLALL